ncbi:MAG: hypothetical protein LBD10_05840 [Desulfobulbus sp.]|uniref:hypothetical protein n=1 Tax=Desulfobulbus sp. TaxID=895 RepID=UPI0028487338|nr:hypothetical protein [Desulfobulbus sp.]MDR2549702.1 hypothetical protein [Desulfobulbus sp.]
MDYIKIFVTVALAVTGWIVVHYFTSRREVNNKRREISIKHLVDAYRVLTHDISHRKLSENRMIELENLISDIQLFGSVEQISLVKNLADDVASGGPFELDPLINSLRSDLRSQLKLMKVEDNVRWLRLGK